MVAVEGGVQVAHLAQSPLAHVIAGHAEHNAVRAHEVLDRCAFFQKLGVGDHGATQTCMAGFGRAAFQVNAPLLQFAGNRCLHPLGRAHGYRGFVDHHFVCAHPAANVTGRFQGVGQVGTAIFLGRCAHGNEDHITMANGLGCVGGELQAALLEVAHHQVVQAGFVNRHHAAVEAADFVRCQVQAHHIVAQFSQASSGDQTHIPAANDGDLHLPLLLVHRIKRCPQSRENA